VTLLELTLCLFLLGIVAASAGSLLVYSANAGNRQKETAEAFENARISLDFLINQTRLAHELRLINYSNSDVLSRLDLHTDNFDGEHVYIFRYDMRNGRLDFGGSKNYPFTAGVNELAYGLKNVEARYDANNEMIYFTVTVEINGDEAVFTGGVDTRYKKINN